MKYWELINVGSKTSLPTSNNSDNEKTTTEKETEKATTMDDRIRQIMDYMEELSSKNDKSNENGYPETILSERESENILTTLLDFQDKYFSNIPLSEKLEGSFVWNIPKPVYKAIKTAQDYEYPDCLNPLYWFYLFCTENPSDMIGKFISLALNSISDEDLKLIEKHADEYDSVYLDNNEDDDSDEDNEEQKQS